MSVFHCSRLSTFTDMRSDVPHSTIRWSSTWSQPRYLWSHFRITFSLARQRIFPEHCRWGTYFWYWSLFCIDDSDHQWCLSCYNEIGMVRLIPTKNYTDISRNPGSYRGFLKNVGIVFDLFLSYTSWWNKRRYQVMKESRGYPAAWAHVWICRWRFLKVHNSCK